MAAALASKTWMQLFTEVSEETPPQKTMETARDHLVKVALLVKPADSVGVGESDLRETDKYKELALPARALMARAVRAANVLSEDAKKRRMIATPQQTRTLEASIATAAGREASSAVIAAALQQVVDEQWTISSMLQKAGLSATPQMLIGPMAGRSLCMAEVEKAKNESRPAFQYIELLDKAMIAVWLPAEATGGKGGLTCEDSSFDKEKLKDINEAFLLLE